MQSLTLSARILSLIIFKGDSIPALKNYGLLNVYIDDYGYYKKHLNCLFFLFKTNTVADYLEFEEKITSFSSFYDYYDLPEECGRNLRMYVFQVNHKFTIDMINFKNNKFSSLSEDFLALIDERRIFHDLKVDLSKEIYRFEDQLCIVEDPT